MKISFVTFGRIKAKECEQLAAYYLKLSSRFADIEHVALPQPKKAQRLEDVFHAWQSKRSSRAFLVVLDERGTQFTSAAFSKQLARIKDGSFTECIIVAGSEHGFAEEFRTSAQLVWSLSSLTFPHELAYVVALEQIFRGFTILAGQKYHNS